MVEHIHVLAYPEKLRELLKGLLLGLDISTQSNENSPSEWTGLHLDRIFKVTTPK